MDLNEKDGDPPAARVPTHFRCFPIVRNFHGRLYASSVFDPDASQHSHHESHVAPASVRQLGGRGLKILHELHAVDGSQIFAILTELSCEVR